MKLKYVPIFVLVGLLVILSSLPVLSSGITNYANARYATNTQTQANNNECNTGTNCGITSPQTQGDDTANSPINLQISNFNEEPHEQDDGVGGELPRETISILVTNCSDTGGSPSIVVCTTERGDMLQCVVDDNPPFRCLYFLSGEPRFFSLSCEDRPMRGTEPQIIFCEVP
jgi:hypothetical protein